jgi:hypothetical protein
LIAAISANLMAAFFFDLLESWPQEPDAIPVSPHPRPRFRRHTIRPERDINFILFNRLTLAPRLLFLSASTPGLIMETMLQGLVIIGGLTFSLAASLLIEELIFGQIVRVAFARRAVISKHSSEHAQKN